MTRTPSSGCRASGLGGLRGAWGGGARGPTVGMALVIHGCAPMMAPMVRAPGDASASSADSPPDRESCPAMADPH